MFQFHHYQQLPLLLTCQLITGETPEKPHKAHCQSKISLLHGDGRAHSEVLKIHHIWTERRWFRIPSLLLLPSLLGDWSGWSLRVSSKPNYSLILYTFRRIFPLAPWWTDFYIKFFCCNLWIVDMEFFSFSGGIYFSEWLNSTLWLLSHLKPKNTWHICDALSSSDTLCRDWNSSEELFGCDTESSC